MNKKVCIIRSNPIKPDSRVEKIAWTLADAGFNVHILAWNRDCSAKEQNGRISIVDKKIDITWLNYKASFGDGFKNIISYLKFQMHMRRWLNKNKNIYDIVHACDFDTAFFSLGIVRKNRKLFVFDIFDFLCGEPRNLFQKCVKKAQLNIINDADATIICSEERMLQIKGSIPHKIAIVHNSPSIKQLNVCLSENCDSKRIKIVYVGVLQDGRLLMEIANYFIRHNDLELHIGGFGKYEKHFQKLAITHNNIKYYGRLSYGKTLALESNCDIMLATYDPSIENHKYAAPNKFYESLMLGKPVVMVRGTGMSKIVELNRIGSVIEYSEVGFEKGIKELLDRKNEWNSIGLKMKEIYKEQYDWTIMANRLIEIYRSLL